MTAPWQIRSMAPLETVAPGTSQVVVVHGMQSASGHISEAEVASSSSSALNAQALELAAKMQGSAASDEGEPGATVQSHEVVMTIQFASLAGRNFMGER
jgi:TonB family protein